MDQLKVRFDGRYKEIGVMILELCVLRNNIALLVASRSCGRPYKAQFRILLLS